MLIYHQLTQEFNQGRRRATLCSGQAVVMHRLAMASKDGDWIVRENETDLAHIRKVLEDHGANYRFGAPLDTRWLAAGWSSHLEFQKDGIRIRTDFFTRPPRLTPLDLETILQAKTDDLIPFTGLKELILMKMTMREKDYPIIGELARRLVNIEDQFLFSRSVRDLLHLAKNHPQILDQLIHRRALLATAKEGEDALATALDAERRILIKADESRLSSYQAAAQKWEAAWPALLPEISNLSLSQSHDVLCDAALRLLPTTL